jgi:hypothetical protein
LTLLGYWATDEHIKAFGDAASLILEAHTKPNNPYLVAIVAYYPSAIPAIKTKFPNSVQVLVHLAGDEINVRKTSEVLGIQGKRKSVRKRIDPGFGYGQTLEIAYKAYTYSGVEPRFAEHDLEEYDAVAAGVAFSRSTATVRKGFRIENDIEAVRDRQVQLINSEKVEKAMQSVHKDAQVMFGPTLTGGIGAEDIEDFYTNFFHPVPSMSNGSLRLLSRTLGTDRVVDEIFLSFKHSQTVPWMLPGVPPTNRQIEIAMVSIFHVRGSKMESEHIYWDQASVLAQAGLLDAKVIPSHMKKKGMTKLPVVGAEGARAIKRGSSKKINDLIPGW